MAKGKAKHVVREIVHTVQYLKRSLSLSMRRRISFDYLVMYLIVSLITLVVFGAAYNILQIGIGNRSLIDEVYYLTLTKEQGSLNAFSYESEILDLSEADGVNLSVRMRVVKGDRVGYQIQTGDLDNTLFEVRYIENLWLFFTKGMVKQSESIPYNFSQEDQVVFDVQIIRPFFVSTDEQRVLLIAILISQMMGITIMSVVGSYRLKKVFMPIFSLTKAAEKITINNMNAKLDVHRAEYELKDLAITFNEMIKRIRADYVKQKRFVSDVSHELRTPISIVNGYARMLDRWGKDDAEILEESIDAIKSESKNMQLLVENLLTLVRSDNQTLKFEREKFRLDLMGDELIRDMMMIDEGRHQFNSDFQRPLEVCLDHAKVMQTLRIFLDNAIKYTPEGGDLGLKLSKVDHQVRIEISDTGIGIGKDDLPHLFERFYRSDESRTRETGGHGLGLAIARAMVIGQGGIIRVKSKVNEGSIFTIILPISCDELSEPLI